MGKKKIDREGMREEMDKADVAVSISVTDGRMKIMSTTPNAMEVVHLVSIAQHALVGTVSEAMFNDQPLDG